jgi:hypothetical protein
LTPDNPYALDTRAHIHQSTGDAAAALSDYELAMRYGGETIVKLYQCGLRSQSLYFGALDGVYSSDVQPAARLHRQEGVRSAARGHGLPTLGILKPGGIDLLSTAQSRLSTA